MRFMLYNSFQSLCYQINQEVLIIHLMAKLSTTRHDCLLTAHWTSLLSDISVLIEREEIEEHYIHQALRNRDAIQVIDAHTQLKLRNYLQNA